MKVSILPAMALSLALAACGGSEDGVSAQPESSSESAPTQAAEPVARGEEAPVAFDLSSAPISTATLGSFPYIAPPTGYEIREERTLDLAAFPMWTGSGFQMPEGRVYMAQSKTPEGKSYSRLEFERGVETAVKALNGVRISRGEVPSQMLSDLPSDVSQDASLGLGDRYGNPFTSYVIRRPDKTIWIQVVAGPREASWAVVDAEAAPQEPQTGR
jgi:OOP family OmpA-OmpF porin